MIKWFKQKFCNHQHEVIDKGMTVAFGFLTYYETTKCIKCDIVHTELYDNHPPQEVTND
jgi:hypothetical protein